MIADMRWQKRWRHCDPGKTSLGSGEGFVIKRTEHSLQLQFQEKESGGKKGTLWFAIPQSGGKEVRFFICIRKMCVSAQAAGNIAEEKSKADRTICEAEYHNTDLQAAVSI